MTDQRFALFDTRIGLCALASLVLLVIPGPAVLFIVTRSVEHGRRFGLASVLGVHLGTLVHQQSLICTAVHLDQN